MRPVIARGSLINRLEKPVQIPAPALTILPNYVINIAIFTLNEARGAVSNWDSLIFTPNGGRGEFAEIAEAFRQAPAIQKPSSIITIQHSHVEWVNIAASHIGLEAISATGHFLPLALVPLEPFGNQTSFCAGFRHRPLFRLAWYGHPQGPECEMLSDAEIYCRYDCQSSRPSDAPDLSGFALGRIGQASTSATVIS